MESGALVTNVTPHRATLIPIRPFASRTPGIITMPREPEDAWLTGGTRSLDRRLLGLNVSGSLLGRKAVVPERVVSARQPAVA
jgi:hypothetical protein